MNIFTTPFGASAWILSEATMERLGWVLVHSLWQFLLLAILAQVVLRLSKRSSASLRYAILVFTTAACVVVPLATWFSLPKDLVAVATDVRNGTMETLPIESTQSPLRSSDEIAIVSDKREVATVLLTIINRPAVESTHSVDESNDWWRNTRDSLRPWLTSIVTVWILGVIICAMRPLLSWIAIRRWRRVGTTPVGKDATELMLRLLERLKIGRTVEILQSTLVHVPLVVGYVRPMILLPASLLSNLPTSQLEAIIAHELAHVRRHDFLVNFMQTIIETLFFYHPAVWWLSHRIRIERENCCDDLVVQTLGNRVEYGRALVAVEQLRADRNALALGVSDGSMLARIRRIAGQTGNGHNSSSWSLVSLLASSLPVVVIIGLVGWHSLAAIPGQTVIEPVADGSILDGSFRNEINLKLTREAAHQGKWYFVDLDQGKLKTPPFEVDIDATRFPYFVNKPSDEELSDWLKHDGVDLILRSSIYRPDPKGPIEKNEIQVRSVRTLLKDLPRGLEKIQTDSPTWQQTLEEDVLDAFGAKDDAVHVVGFIPNTTAIDIRPDSPLLQSFRTASNLLGVFLLEQPNSNDDELRLRIAYAANKDMPLDDLRFGPDDFVSGIESLDHPVVRKSSEAAFEAKFPNDVRVEFVGLSRGVGDIKAADKWWRPDGTPLQHAPEHRGASGVLQDGELESENPYVRTVIHVHGIGDNNAVTATAAIQSADSLKDKSGGQYVAHHGYVDAPARTRTFEVGVATDALSPKRWLNRDGKRIESKTEPGTLPAKDLIAEDITIEKVGTESWGKRVTNKKSLSKGGLKDPIEPGDEKMGSSSGTTQVTIRFPLLWRNVDLRLFAIDKSGNSHAADTTIKLDPNDDNADYKRLAKVIPVDYSEVDHFEYQFRVYRHWAIFENVSLWKGTETEVVMKSETIPTTSRAATSADNVKHSAVGVLPNGDTVELIHLATAAGSGVTGKRVWWKPDGTLDEEANATEIEPKTIQRIANDRRLFEIHMSSTNLQPSIHLKTIPPVRLEDSAYVDFTNENGKPARSLSGQFGPVGNEKQITLKVGVTSEPWGEWQDVGLAGEPLSPFDDKQNYADFYRMIKVVSAGQLLVTMLPPPEKVPLLSEKAVSNEKPDANWVSTVATIQLPENHDDLFAFEFRAVGTNGATNYANVSTGTDSSGKTQFFFNGDVLREKLTKYQYRLRPYRNWVTFEDVANQAGAQTNPKIGVQAAPAINSTAISFAPQPAKGTVASDSTNKPTAKKDNKSNRIVDGQGNPVAGAKIDCLPSMKYSWLEAPKSLGSTVADSDGWFDYPDELPPKERFYVYVTADAFLERVFQANNGEAYVLENGVRKPDTLVLRRPVTVSGRIVGVDGKPLADAEIAVDYMFDNGVAQINGNRVKSDADGRFVATGVEPANVFVRYQTPFKTEEEQMPIGTQPGKLCIVTFTATDGQQKDDIVLDLSKCNCIIEGSIVDHEDKGVPNRWIQATIASAKGRLDESITVKSDAEGRFRFEGLTADEFEIGTHTPGRTETVKPSLEKPTQVRLTTYVQGKATLANDPNPPIYGDSSASGIVGGIRLRGGVKPRLGGVITAEVLIKNNSDQVQMFAYSFAEQANLRVFDGDKAIAELNYSYFTGLTVTTHYRLEPNQEAVVGSFDCGLHDPNDNQNCPPKASFEIPCQSGQALTLRCDMSANLFGRAKEDIAVSQKDAPLSTGTLSMKVMSTKELAQVVPETDRALSMTAGVEEKVLANFENTVRR